MGSGGVCNTFPLEGVVKDARRVLVLGLLADGFSLRATARLAGLSKATVGVWARDAGLVFTPSVEGGGLNAASLEKVGTDPDLVVLDGGDYTDARGRLTLAGRGAIQVLITQGLDDAQIGQAVGVHPTTIWRERRRGKVAAGGYSARAAQAGVEANAKRPRPRKLDDPVLRAAVIERLNQRWSPEQVAADLRRTFPDREDMWVSHETIYQALYVQGKGSLRQELALEKATRTGRTARTPRSDLPARSSNRSWIGPEAHLSARPAEAADRAVPGHWEGDLVIGARSASAVLTLVERSTRYLMTYRLPDLHDAPTVTAALVELIGTLPGDLARTLTWDQGSELAAHPTFTIATGCQVFFCDPHSPWQRGSNENTNGLLRDWYPKGTDFGQVSDADLAEATRLLNTRPRKTLDWDTPTARLQALLAVAHPA